MDSDYFSQTQNSVTANHSDRIAGTVIRIHMKNFMCHDNLEVKLNPNINFFVGKNGSGKSAIQTAIAIGLGGKALSTNRGSSMKALIKNDKNSCSLLIVLSNEGPLAYSRNLYGSSIQVERFFTHSSSGYKLRNSSGKVVSTEKKELDKILAQFNIQTDNPVCILHQDIARNFLNSSDSQNKYKFYMKASRFDEISKLYSESLFRTHAAKECVQSKAETVKETFKDVIELGNKLKLFKDAKEKEIRKNDLETELVWANIKEKNEALEELHKRREVESSAKARTERKLKDGEDNDLKEKLKECQEKIKALDESVGEARENLQQAREYVSRKTQEKRNAAHNCEEARQRKAMAKKRFECCQKEMENLTKNAPEIKQRQEKIKTNIAKCESEVERLDSTEEIVKHEIQQLKDTVDKHRASFQENNQRCAELQRQLSVKTNQIRDMSGSSNSLSVYGPAVGRAVQEMERAVRQGAFKKPPIGPIGKYIKVRDPKWAGPVENFLSKNTLMSFCSDNSQDTRTLSEIFKRVFQGQSQPPIITSKFFDKVHNISSSETGNQKYSSLAKVLEFEHPVVANCLIDQQEIETVLLIPTNEEAYLIMGEQHLVVRNCRRAFTLTGDLFYPAPNYKSYSSGKAVTRATLLHSRQEDLIRELRTEVDALNQELRTVKGEAETVGKEMYEATNFVNKNEQELRKLRQERNKYMQKLNELREAVEPEATNNLDFFLQEVKELEKKYEESEQQYQESNKKLEQLSESLREAKDKYENLNNIIAEADKEKAPIQAEIQRLKSSMQQASHKATFMKQKIQEHENKLTELETEIGELTQSVNEYTENASQLCEPVDTCRSPAEIAAELKRIEQYLRRLEERNGGNYEEIQRCYNERKTAFEIVNGELNLFTGLIMKTEHCLIERSRRKAKIMTLLANSAKHNFQIFLNERNFEGKLEFDMDNKKLEIKVKPQREGPGMRQTDLNRLETSSLSGGEKSFSTVCFIMALWQEIQLPFHFLDEFDVFMDAINRRTVMDLLIAYAKKVNQQFVFLTPLDMSSVHVDEKVTIHRLAAPRQ